VAPLSQRVPKRSLEAIVIDTHTHTHTHTHTQRVTPPADDATHRSIDPAGSGPQQPTCRGNNPMVTRSLVSLLTCNFLTRKTNKHNKTDDHTERRMKNSHTNSDGVVLRNQGSRHTKKPRKKEKHSAGDGCKQDTSTFTSVQLASPLASNGV
jgi:hypothetical protein